MAFQSIQSSNIKAIDYTLLTGTLTIRFNSGKEYEYSGVSPATYAAFLAAPSAGAFFSSTIRNAYAGKEVPGSE